MARRRCLVLVGKTGAGKSSTANTIVGAPPPGPFRSKRAASGVTRTCALAPCAPPGGLAGAEDPSRAVDDPPTRWCVVDTPGLCDAGDGREAEDVLLEIERCVDLAASAAFDDPSAAGSSSDGDLSASLDSSLAGGVDAFAYVMSAVGRVTSGDLDALAALGARFGPDAFANRLVFVLTHADALEADGQTAEDFLRDAPRAFVDVARRAGGGPEPVLVDNRAAALDPDARARFGARLAGAVRRAMKSADEREGKGGGGGPHRRARARGGGGGAGAAAANESRAEGEAEGEKGGAAGRRGARGGRGVGEVARGRERVGGERRRAAAGERRDEESGEGPKIRRRPVKRTT